MESGKAPLIRFTSSSQLVRLKNLKKSVSLQPNDHLTMWHVGISAMDSIDYSMPCGEDSRTAELKTRGIHAWKYVDDDSVRFLFSITLIAYSFMEHCRCNQFYGQLRTHV